MTARQIIEMAVAYCGITNSELARRLEWSPQLLNKRLNTGKFTVEEWQRIAEALGADAKVGFVFPGGGSVGL
ncbi:winged helix-turn-helix domain-containing protein [Intestinimonas butyriciproducens]|uniref:winged helix-turn-helix domain-containing protein n=1 Tax=Intestinimonas butyriciproducens TaxID=1297617 RepID=UPI0034A1544E